jgi:hypothetical protein
MHEAAGAIAGIEVVLDCRPYGVAWDLRPDGAPVQTGDGFADLKLSGWRVV